MKPPDDAAGPVVVVTVVAVDISVVDAVAIDISVVVAVAVDASVVVDVSVVTVVDVSVVPVVDVFVVTVVGAAVVDVSVATFGSFLSSLFSSSDFVSSKVKALTSSTKLFAGSSCAPSLADSGLSGFLASDGFSVTGLNNKIAE